MSVLTVFFNLIVSITSIFLTIDNISLFQSPILIFLLTLGPKIDFKVVINELIN